MVQAKVRAYADNPDRQYYWLVPPFLKELFQADKCYGSNGEKVIQVDSKSGIELIHCADVIRVVKIYMGEIPFPGLV